MRIIGGKHRARKIEFIESEDVRPTSDMVRQAFFTKYQFDISGSSFLDLFAGSGSVGLEAISRNAEKVVFVDKNKKCIDIIKTNLKKMNENAVVFFGSFDEYLSSSKERFDFIYIDPPYKSGHYEKALEIIKQRNLLKEDGVIVCECDYEIELKQDIYELVDKRKYGRKCLYYLKNVEGENV